MAGIPIYSTPGKGGGISLLPGYSFDKTLLSDEEQNNLIFAVQSLKAVDSQMDVLVKKLGIAFQKQRADWITVDFSRWGFQHTDVEYFDILKNAILKNHVLTIIYCSTSGKTLNRNIHPLKLVYKDKNWYIQAYCLYADDFRLFKISRIIEIQITEEIFNADYTDDIPPVEIPFLSNFTEPILLRFSQNISHRVYDEFYKSNITHESDGSLSVKVNFSMDIWVIGYLFSFGTEIRVLEPISLKLKLAEYAEKIATHHKR